MIETRRSTTLRDAAPAGAVLHDDTLTGSEARDLVLGLLETSVDHHKLRNLGAQVRAQAPDPAAQRHLRQLGAAREEALAQLREASALGLGVRVRATLELELVPRTT